MPIYEFLCASCGAVSERLVMSGEDRVDCPRCGGSDMRKLLSATSSASGAREGTRLPSAGDTGCCGSSPGSQGCVPGSCCGKAG